MKDKFILIDVGNTALKWATLEDPDNPHTIVHSGEGHFKKELYELWESLNPSYVLGCTVAHFLLPNSLMIIILSGSGFVLPCILERKISLFKMRIINLSSWGLIVGTRPSERSRIYEKGPF